MMKKFKLLLVVVMVAILTTGCGSTKKLSCSMDQSMMGINMGLNVSFKFKNEKVSNLTMKITMKAENDAIKEGWSDAVASLNEQYKDESAEGVKLSTKNDDKNYTYTVTLDVDLNKASKESLEKYDLDEFYDIAKEKTDIEEVKKSAEADGFKCE